MKSISALTKHYKDPTYDRVTNPARRPIAELLPIAVTWLYRGQLHRIDFEPSGAACALSDMSGVAVIDGLYESGSRNRAYIVNADGSIRFVLSKPMNGALDDSFSDVYYVGDALSFFVSGSAGERRIEYDADSGLVLRFIESR